MLIKALQWIVSVINIINHNLYYFFYRFFFAIAFELILWEYCMYNKHSNVL